MYLPDVENLSLKKILLWNELYSWGNLPDGQDVFLQEQCPVKSCTITSDKHNADDSALIIFKNNLYMPSHVRKRNQIWMMYLLESPYHTERFYPNNVFNWTATYR